MARRADDVLRRLGAQIDVRQRVKNLSVADQQMVEIARAFIGSVKVLILDEPTAVIFGVEVDLLFERLLALRAAPPPRGFRPVLRCPHHACSSAVPRRKPRVHGARAGAGRQHCTTAVRGRILCNQSLKPCTMGAPVRRRPHEATAWLAQRQLRVNNPPL